MPQAFRGFRTDDRGFTLLNSLIAIALFGTLTGIAAVAAQPLIDKVVAVACQADVRNVTVAAQAYFVTTGSHTVDPDGAGAKTAVDVLVEEGYLTSKPSNDRYTVTLAAGVADGC
jgi:type II secretory pathway pseudopilin PulG